MKKPCLPRLAALLLAALLILPAAALEDPHAQDIAQARAALIEDFDISPRLLTQGTYSTGQLWRQDGQTDVGMVTFVSEVTDHVYTVYLSLEGAGMLRAEEFYNAGDVCVTRTLMDQEAPAQTAYGQPGGQGEEGRAIRRYAAAQPLGPGDEDLPRAEAERIARAYFERELGLVDSLAFQVTAELLGDGGARWWLVSLRARRVAAEAYQVAVDAHSGLVLAATLTADFLEAR